MKLMAVLLVFMLFAGQSTTGTGDYGPEGRRRQSRRQTVTHTGGNGYPGDRRRQSVTHTGANGYPDDRRIDDGTPGKVGKC